jgi:hypothetical protein
VCSAVSFVKLAAGRHKTSGLKIDEPCGANCPAADLVAALFQNLKT